MLLRGQRTILGTIIAVLLGASVVVVVEAARATGSYTAEGHVQQASTLGLSVTDTEWRLSCPGLPSLQGHDAFVFALPPDFDATGTTTTAAGSSPAVYSLGAHFYGADCARVGSSTATTGDLTAPTPAGTRFVVVAALRGSDIQVTLTVGAPPEPEPSPSASSSPTPTASPTPGPTGPRRHYSRHPNDPLFGAESIVMGGQWGMRKIKAPETWQKTKATGAGVRVAVIDSGLDLDHPDFQCEGKVDVIANSDFVGDGNGPLDGNGHGTHVAGIVGACTNNREGVVGVAPDATLMPIQLIDAEGSGTTTPLPDAIRAAVDAGAHVINMSLSTFPANSALYAAFEEAAPEIEDAIDYATSEGVVVVAAAGNFGIPICGHPAIAAGVVCVGSSDNRDLKSWFGQFPIKPAEGGIGGAALLAPGGAGITVPGVGGPVEDPTVGCDVHSENIVSTYARSKDDCDEGYPGYKGLDGTSMASPHVAGVAALVYDRLGGTRTVENAEAVVRALVENADDLYAPGYDPASGYGRVNALAAVASLPRL